MSLNLKAKYFEDTDEKLIFYPRADLIIGANIAFILSTGIYIITALICGFDSYDDGFDTDFAIILALFLLLPFWTASFLLYYNGFRKIIVDKVRKEIKESKPFGQKHIADLSDVSHIEYKEHLTLDAGRYVCYFKSAPNGKGLKLSADFRTKHNPKFDELTKVAIPLFLSLLPEGEKNIPIPEKTIADLQLFKPIADGVYSYRYTDCSSFMAITIMAAILFLIPFLMEAYFLFALLIIPVVMAFRKSQVVVDKNSHTIFSSVWWGFEKDCFYYTDITSFSYSQYSNGEGQYMGVDIWAQIPNSESRLVVKRMMNDEKAARLMEEVVLLIGE